MKRLLSVALALTLLLTLGFAAIPAQAQDEMMTHVCDSTLIALLYIAEHDYGFHSMMDVASFDKGQYAPLFDEMMAMMPTEESMMSDDMMATEEAMMSDDTMMGEMTMLAPGSVAGEDEACTALRAELDAFLYTALSEGMMMESGS